MNIRNKLLHFIKGFRYAFSGIIYCIKTERNMRFHIGAAIIVLVLAIICQIGSEQSCILFLTVGSVIALECVNTAIENTVDLSCGKERKQKAKAAKDTAAGAVLVMSVMSLCVGAAIFINKTNLTKIYDYFRRKLFSLVLVIIFIVLWAIWVLLTENKKDKD